MNQNEFYAPNLRPSRGVRVMSILALVFGIASMCTWIFGIDFAIAGIVLANLAAIKNRDAMPTRARVGQTLSIVGAAISGVYLAVWLLNVMQFAFRFPLWVQEIVEYYVV